MAKSRASGSVVERAVGSATTRRANRSAGGVVLGYKLKLFPNAVKRWMLGALADQFAREHAKSLERLAVNHPAQQVSLKGLKQKGHGEFKQRATRRAVLDLQRQRKAQSVATKLCPWPTPLPKLKARLLDAAEVQDPRKATGFDRWVHVEGLAKSCQLYVPAKQHAGINKALALPGAVLSKGAEIFERAGQWYARVSVTIPTPAVQPPVRGWIGADVGVRSAVATSDGRKSKGLHPVLGRMRERLAERQRQRTTRKTNGLSYQRQVLAREARRSVTLAAATGRGIALETPSRLVRWKQHASRFFGNRVELLAKLTGVPVVLVHPAYTSQTCSSCGSRDSFRQRRMFRCQACGHTANADVNAARNIAQRGATAFRAVQT